MELGKRLKEYRSQSGMTQDELAERLYVTRQTISNWENDKSYPDIHSLLMLGELFNVSLDTLVKGDIEIMKETIDQENIRSFKRDSNIYGILLLVCVVTFFPLYKWGGIPGMIIWGLLFAAALFFAVRVEEVKKQQDIHTYKEIVAFTNGEKLDHIKKAREEGKRNYQLVIAAVVCAALGFLVPWIISAVI
ncbi:MAG: helix-turn-helix transcriptional regulator [Clostridia bacterium]|nr:helix-turn-helix transcriptional regulator [Clostridia bacterium]